MNSDIDPIHNRKEYRIVVFLKCKDRRIQLSLPPLITIVTHRCSIVHCANHGNYPGHLLYVYQKIKEFTHINSMHTQKQLSQKVICVVQCRNPSKKKNIPSFPGMFFTFLKSVLAIAVNHCYLLYTDSSFQSRN